MLTRELYTPLCTLPCVIVVVEWLWRQHKACIETVFIVYSNLLSGTHQEEYKRKNETISEGETISLL